MKYKILKFSTSCCGQCKVLEQKLKGFDKGNIENIDADAADEELLAKYAIRNVPVTIIVDENGEEKHKWVGLFDVKQLEEKLEELSNA